MSRLLPMPRGKTPTKISDSGKKASGAKVNTLYTSNMNQVVESSEINRVPKTPKQSLGLIETYTKQTVELNGKSIFKKYVPPNIESDDVTRLLKLKYANGNFIIDDQDKDVIIEVIGMLNLYNIDYVLDFLEDAPNKEWIFWEPTFMNIGKVSVEREIFINRAEEIGVKGVGKCRYCPGTELVFAQKQVNSGDEPMKVYVRCVTCNQHWKQG